MLSSGWLLNGLRRFRVDRAGSIAPIFGLVIIPLLATVGASVDYSRMINAQSRMQSTTDSISLLVSKELEAGANVADIEAQVQKMFGEAMAAQGITSWHVDFNYEANTYTVVVDATADLPTTFMGVVGISKMNIAANTTTVNGTDFVEIAMVLDNTGSMGNLGKLDQLKIAAKDMIQKLSETPAGKAGKTKVSIIPFGVPVNVGTAYNSASWLGPEQTKTTCNKKGCTTTTLTWQGCVGDRVSPYTTDNVPATGGSTLYPRYYGSCSLTTILPLTSDLPKASTKVDAMIASGNTNIPVGVMWGWNMLTPSQPLSNSSSSTTATKVLRYMILLTDGDNTQNTLGSSTGNIDLYTKDACTAVKKQDIVVFSIRVIDGNAALLKDCASAPEYYYDVSDASMLLDVFQQIMANITRLRLAS